MELTLYLWVWLSLVASLPVNYTEVLHLSSTWKYQLPITTNYKF